MELVKVFLTKLKTTLLYKNLNNNYHFIVLGLASIGLIYRTHNLLVILGFVLLNIYIIKKNPRLITFTYFIFAVFILGLIIREVRYENRILGEKCASFVVIAREEGKLTVKNKNLKYQIYTEDYYEIGDILWINGEFTDIDSNHLPLLFNYQEYAKFNDLVAIVKKPQIRKTGERFVIAKIQYFFSNYYDSYFSNLSSSYLKALVLGDKNDLDDQVKKDINNLGISHLFVVSGLHVSLLIGIITKIMNKLFKKTKIVNLVSTVILIFYALITNLMVSVLRVVLGFIIKNLNQEYHLHLKNLDILSVVAILLLLINPYFLFRSSFILSFGLTYALLIGSMLLQDQNFLKSLVKMSLYCQIISLPLVYNFSNKINLLSVFFNLIFVPFVSYIFLPVSLIISFLPFLNRGYELVIKLFEWLVSLATKISVYINFPTVDVGYILIFFIIIYILFKMLEKRKIKKIIFLILFIYIIIWINAIHFDIYDQIIFFDLPNGEATLIHQAFNRGNILIDTGDITTSDNQIVSYLQKRGIKKLDYVIITHSDSDHIGGLVSLMQEIKVKNIITSYYEKKNIFDYYYKYNPHLKIYYFKKGYNFSFKNITINCLSPTYNLGDVNNNSLVFLLNVNNFKILFTGDIEAQGEKTLDFNITCDILKIAHHGSKTSTTKEFLAKVQYDTAIIMNGYNNIFDFPSSLVVNRLKEKPYYVTSNEKTIIYQKLFFKERYVKI